MKQRIVTIVQARMGSTRLPGKVLKPILGRPMLYYLIERLHRIKKSDLVVIATSDQAEYDQIADLCQQLEVKVFRGSERNVLERYYQAAQFYEADIVIRLTADCPLMDPEVVDYGIETFLKEKEIGYLSNNRKLTYPHGLDFEIFPFSSLKAAYEADTTQEEKEHVTFYLTRHPERFRILNVLNPDDPSGEKAYYKYRWTVDYIEDFELIKRVLVELYPTNPQFGWKDVISLLERHSDWIKLNQLYSEGHKVAE